MLWGLAKKRTEEAEIASGSRPKTAGPEGLPNDLGQEQDLTTQVLEGEEPTISPHQTESTITTNQGAVQETVAASEKERREIDRIVNNTNDPFAPQESDLARSVRAYAKDETPDYGEMPREQQEKLAKNVRSQQQSQGAIAALAKAARNTITLDLEDGDSLGPSQHGWGYNGRF